MLSGNPEPAARPQTTVGCSAIRHAKRPYECRHRGRNCMLQPAGTLSYLCLHWFRQCTDPIHSAYKNKPLPNSHAAARRTSSVRRQSAVRGSCSPEQPPLTALLPCQGNGRSQRSVRSTSPDGVFNCCVPVNSQSQAPQPFRSCSSRHHSRITADGSRLPCRADSFCRSQNEPV